MRPAPITRRVLLVSTYELGAQPLGLAEPAAALVEAGHEVRTCDLAVEPWPAEAVAWAEAVAFSVPMHTALRLALEALARVRSEHPGLPTAFHGLYAPVAATTGLLGPSDLVAAGETNGLLLTWLTDLEPSDGAVPEKAAVPGSAVPAVHVELGRPRHTLGPPPRRTSLPDLSLYARLAAAGEERLVGTLETTRGCNHTCRHCPVPVVYRGRSRAVDLDSLLADADRLVEAGAGHLHLADADLLNRPRHALGFVEAFHRRHPSVTFDATIKVSHLLRHKDALGALGAAGCLYVVSAFESTSDLVLDRLDKGHTSAELDLAVGLLRNAGIEVRPSFLPFTPWTAPGDLVDLLDLVARLDLVWNVDPVQYGIRLLLPPGSLLLEDPDETLRAQLGPYDPDELGYPWSSPDPRLDELQGAVAASAEAAAASSAGPEDAYEAVRALVHDHLGRPDAGRPARRSEGLAPGPDRPRLTEAWFCCAEPTSSQRARLLDGCASTEL